MDNPTKISMLEPDMENRDPNAINNHSVVTFYEVLGEPDDMHSLECTWKYANICFDCTFNVFYKTMAAICGIPLAVIWALQFACVGFCHVWTLTPLVQSCQVNLMLCQRILGLCVHCVCDPCYQSMGLIFSQIKITHDKPDF